jgi:hypothetical protein
MSATFFPVIAAWANVAIFALAGLVNATAPGAVRDVYARWDIPVVFYRTLGVVEIVAATFLATPDWRLWGIVLAAPIMFGAIVMLLDHRLYGYAAPAMVALTMLIPATLG